MISDMISCSFMHYIMAAERYHAMIQDGMWLVIITCKNIEDFIFLRSSTCCYRCSWIDERSLPWNTDGSSKSVWLAGHKHWFNTLRFFCLGLVKGESLLYETYDIEITWRANTRSCVLHPTRVPQEITWLGFWAAWNSAGECCCLSLNTIPFYYPFFTYSTLIKILVSKLIIIVLEQGGGHFSIMLWRCMY